MLLEPSFWIDRFNWRYELWSWIC